MSLASEHYTLSADEAEAIWFLGTLATIRAARTQTGGALAVVEFLHPPGFATPRHVHSTENEAFYVLAGAMRGYCGDRTWHATTGAFVWLPRGVPHGYAVDGDEPLRTLAITLPAGFDGFVREAGEPAQERRVPPPAAPDMEKLLAAAAVAPRPSLQRPRALPFRRPPPSLPMPRRGCRRRRPLRHLPPACRPSRPRKR